MGEIDDLKEVLKSTFSKIKEDISSTSVKIDSYETKISRLVKENKELSKQINSFQARIDEIKSAKPVVRTTPSTSSKKIKELVDENNMLNERLEKLEAKIKALSSLESNEKNAIDEARILEIIDEKIKASALAKPSPKKPDIKEEVLRQFDKKRKDIIKNKIIELASQGKMTLPELKEVIVDQSCYCSKASFYRYVERMKLRQLIDFVEINGISIVVPSKGIIRQK